MLARSLDPICADDLTCPICLERFTSPLLLPCCANSFCRLCLKKALARRPACPLCNAEADYADALPNRTLTRLLASQPDGGGGSGGNGGGSAPTRRLPMYAARSAAGSA